MESYIVRIYRGERDNPRSFVGIVEEVDSQRRTAFTNLEELWDILNAIKSDSQHPRTNVRFTTEQEKRCEERAAKGIPCTFLFDKCPCKASIVNMSEYGFGIRTHDKLPIKLGNMMKFKMKDSSAVAQMMWMNETLKPSAITAGFKLMEGSLTVKPGKKIQAFPWDGGA
jgi:hypothetical protein